MEEKTFFQRGNIAVTNTRFVVGNETYTMSGLTSVKTSVKDGPSRIWPVLLFIIGVAGVVAPVDGLRQGVFGPLYVLFFFGGIGAIVLAVRWWRSQRSTLQIVLKSASGEIQALESQDAALIHEVSTAINQAIVYRG